MLDKNRVVVAMSGGVDSSVVAGVLKNEGYDVIGITMKTWGFMEVGGAPKYESGCCSLDAIYDAKNVSDSLNIPHYTVDFTKSFENTVINDFVDEYLNGRTPNPCVLCNRKIKWEELLKKADSLDAFYVATGHYAVTGLNKKNNRYYIKKSADANKDQSYALWGLTQESLSRTLLPLGRFTKPEVRDMASAMNLKNASKPDSQEICFVPDNDYERFLRERVPEKIENIKEGNFVYQGETVGKHKGIPFYTIGQRKGLGLAMGKPMYVKKINTVTNEIELGERADIRNTYLEAKNVNFVGEDKLATGSKVLCKIRYSDPGSPATILECDETSIRLNFHHPKSAITPGQSVVVYNEEGYVLAGGVIEANLN